MSSQGTQLNLDWPSIHTLPYKTTRDTKMQSFAFKIQYRIISCNKYLNTIRIRLSPQCSFCDMEDSISHFFLKCEEVQRFWDSLSHWCETHLDISLSQLSQVEKLLGVCTPAKESKLLNWLLLQAKFFIHRNRLFHGNRLPLIAFLAEIRAKLYTEQRACYQELRPNKFKVWQKLFNALG